jgi:Hint domain
MTDSAAPCFLRGTSVLTSQGETSVEKLAVGDLVVTAKGPAIKWIGRWHFKKDGQSRWPKTLLPVRVSRFAL